MKKISKNFLHLIALIITVLLISCNKKAEVTQTYSASTFPKELAQNIATKYHPKINNSTKVTIETEMQSDNQITSTFTIKDEKLNDALYIFNLSQGGFLVMSAEIYHEPICAFIETGAFNPEDEIPAGLSMWYNKTVDNIQAIREGVIDNKQRALYAWNELAKSTNSEDLKIYISRIAPPNNSGSGANDDPSGCDNSANTYNNTYGPLLQTTWGQGRTYNDLCPSMNCANTGNGRAWAGCVPTSMAQIIRYNHPLNSFGYNYTSMPNSIGNNEVSRLISDIGSKLPSMKYGCSGSSATFSDINATLSSFGLSSLYSSSNSTGYYSKITNDIHQNKPVILGGCNDQKKFLGIPYNGVNCHAWVCDGSWELGSPCYGYQFLHMNWGWHETWNGNNDFNGWYVFANWNIPGRALNFQYCKEIIYDIK